MWARARLLVLLGCVAAMPSVSGAQQARFRPVIAPPVQYARVLPEACVVVPEVVDRLRLEGRQADSGLYTPERDQLSPEARAEVAQCVAAYGATSPHPWQWLAVARAQLALSHDSAAKVWHDKYLARFAAASLPRRAWARHLVVLAYAEARPPRIPAAEAALRTLEAMGRPAARARLLAHKGLMEAAARQWNDPLQVREARACLAAYQELTGALRDDVMTGPAAACVLSEAEVVLRRQGGSPALAILDSGLALLPPGSIGWRSVRWWRPMYALVGKPGTPIDATRWFRHAGAVPKPARGTVTLVHTVSHEFGIEPQYHALRRLAARFARRPFELIAQAKTTGFFGDSAAPITPEREMVLDSAYFYGHAGMPGMLAVHATPFAIGADGRRMEQETPYERHYAAAPLVVIDKRGVVRYVGGGVGGQDEEILARLIEALLAEP